MAPPPRPWTSRPATRTAMLPAVPAISRPSTNTATETYSGARGPRRSDQLPGAHHADHAGGQRAGEGEGVQACAVELAAHHRHDGGDGE